MHPMDVHLMGVACVEAFRIFNLVFGKKSLYPTVVRRDVNTKLSKLTTSSHVYMCTAVLRNINYGRYNDVDEALVRLSNIIALHRP
jgi:hypothetical protein